MPASVRITTAERRWLLGATMGVLLIASLPYLVGALAAGLLADAFGSLTAIAAIGALTLVSGVIVAAVMRETL
jgi:membrane associated rhomboid family serine protease